MARDPTCKLHPEVPPVLYDGARWCPACEAGRQQLEDLLRAWVLFCQWGLVLSVPLCLASLCFLARPDPFHATALPQAFWWRILFPSAFVSAGVATAVGHLTLRRFGRVTGWFHPTHALRDGALIALGFSLAYTSVLSLGPTIFGIHPPAEGIGPWLCSRAPFVLVIGGIACVLPVNWRLVTGDALLPRSPRRYWWVAVHATWLVLVYLPVQWGLVSIAPLPMGSWILLASAGAVFFFSLLYPVVRLALRRTAGYLDPPRDGPLSTTVVLIGPPDVGKTVFLTRAYRLLERAACGESIRLAPTWESREILSPLIDLLEGDHAWLPGTIRVSAVPFSLFYGTQEIIRFTWIDPPGGVFAEPMQWPAEAEAFQQRLASCDAVVMLIDAQELERGRQPGRLPFETIYHAATRELHRRLEAVGEGARPVPLAIVLTPSCRTKVGRRRLWTPALLRQIACHWQAIAVAGGLKPHPVGIFFQRAVDTRPDESELIPRDEGTLRSDECVQPVIWLAAQLLRVNMTLLDFAAGFGAPSTLQEAILWLERRAW